MKKLFANLNLYTKTFVVAFGSGVLVSLVLMILGFCDLLSLFIPLGIFLGSLFSAFSYFALGKIDCIECDSARKAKLTMAVIYIRLFLLLAFEITEVILQLKANIVLFNPFGFLGAYLFTTIVFTIFAMGAKHASRA